MPSQILMHTHHCSKIVSSIHNPKVYTGNSWEHFIATLHINYINVIANQYFKKESIILLF